MSVRPTLGVCRLGAALAASLPASADPPRPSADSPRIRSTRAERAGYPPEKLAPMVGELGACEAALGKYRDAAEHLYQSLRYSEALTREQEARFRRAQQGAEREVVMEVHLMPSSSRSLLLALSSLALGCTSAARVCGCHPYDCSQTLQCGSDPELEQQPTGDACIADPAAGVPEDRCGVFVSSSLGSDDNPGTSAQPVRSMEQAIALALSGPKRRPPRGAASAPPGDGERRPGHDPRALGGYRA